MAGVKGQYVRHYDSLGRMYVTPRAGGQRVPRALWYEERAQIARVRKEGAKAAELGEIPETGGPGMPPFPPSIEGVRVSDVGVPEREVWIDEEGVSWDLPEPVQGDDDT
jgi:hypothetical protein